MGVAELAASGLMYSNYYYCHCRVRHHPYAYALALNSPLPTYKLRTGLRIIDTATAKRVTITEPHFGRQSTKLGDWWY
jgi:hypothetical protein